jgi:hypothetical protein
LAKFPFSASVSRSFENLIYPDFRKILCSLIEASMQKNLQQAQLALDEFFESVDDEKLLKWISESQNPIFINSVRYLLNLTFENQQTIHSFLSKPCSKPSIKAKVHKLFTLCCLSNHQDGLKQLGTLARKKAEEGKVEFLKTCFFTSAQYPQVFEALFFQLTTDSYRLPFST